LFGEIKSHPNNLLINATEVAKKLGNSKAANMVLLGAASSLIPLSEESIIDAIKSLFKRKSERVVKLNLKAFEAGKQLASENASLV